MTLVQAMWLAVFVVGWMACAIAATGLAFAYFQGKYPEIAEESYSSDKKFAWGMGLLGGPFSLGAALVMFGTRYGWRLR